MRNAYSAAVLVLALGPSALMGCHHEPAKPKAASGPSLAAGPALRPALKPGERVRQPELDGYCADGHRAAAFYYHGGNPSVRIAIGADCAPLYLTECEAEGRCYPPRDQEPGMWCCAPADVEQPPAHATR